MRVVVVGGGISGLTAARAAAAAGFDVLLVEGAAEVGGKLKVVELAGVPVDVGAEAVLTVRPEGVALLEDVGLAGDRIAPLTTAARVRAGGRSHPLPARTMMGVPGDVEAVRESGVLTDAGLAALAAEAGRPPLPPLQGDVAVGTLVRERMGDEVADRLVEPLLGGVYAGRADELSLRATVPALAARLAEGGSLLAAAASLTDGSRTAGTRAPGSGSIFTTLRGGLGRLPGVLAAGGSFEVRTGTTARAIRRTPTGFEVEVGAVPVAEALAADAVIVAVPPAKAARLLRDVAPVAAAELAGIDSASMAVVSFAFPGDVALPEGSGLLVGAGERLAVKAVTLSSRKWPLDGADGLTLLRASVGRAGETAALRLDDQELVTLVRRELRMLLGISAEPVDSRVTRWGGGLPQYAAGHVERIARVRAAVAEVDGLAVCGAAFDGVGIPACIAAAHAAAARVESCLRARGQ